jgi:hypothetical protein
MRLPTSLLESFAESAVGRDETELTGADCCVIGEAADVGAGGADGCEVGTRAGSGATGPTPRCEGTQASVRSVMAYAGALRIMNLCPSHRERESPLRAAILI